MKKLLSVGVLTILPPGSIISGLSDAATFSADAGAPSNEVTTAMTETSSSSASATITTTMYAVDNE